MNRSMFGILLTAGLVGGVAAADLRVAHLSPDAPAVDVWLDNSVALAGVAYPAFSPYLDVSAGPHRVRVFVAGSNQNPVIDATLPFVDGQALTVAATGLLADGSFGPVVIPDTRDVSPTQAWVRFSHSAADAPAVDITLPDGTVLFGDVVFNESTAYLPVAPGSYDLQVRLAGSSTVVLAFRPVELSAGTTVSVFATGTLAAGTLGALAAVDAPGDGSTFLTLESAGTHLRVAHLSPDAPAVDVWLDGAAVLTGVPYPAFSPYLDIPGGSHHVQVFVAGTNQSPVIDATLDFTPGSVTTVAATGLLGNGSFGPLVLTDTRQTSPTEAWVRFIHGAGDAPAVDITLPDGTVLFGDVAFNESMAYLPVAPGSYDLQVRLAGSSTVVLAFQPVDLTAGTTLSVFATGSLAAGTLGALAAVDAPGDGSTFLTLESAGTHLRVAHLSPDAPAVDVWLDGAAVLTGVPYPAFSPYLDITGGSHHVQVFVAGTNENPVIDATLDFTPGSVTTVAATGLLGDGSFGPLVLTDTRQTSPTEAWVRFIHGAGDAPAVDITLPDGTVLFGDVAFNESTAHLPVAPGFYGLQVRLAGSSTVVLNFLPVELGAGTTLSVFAAGSLAAGSLGALVAIDSPGDGSQTLWLEQASAVVAGGGRPLGLELSSAYPNPFNPLTTLGFRLDRAQQVRLSVYNSLGQTVAVLQDGLLGAGEHARSWNAAGFPSGLYYAQLEGQGLSQVRTLTLIK